MDKKIEKKLAELEKTMQTAEFWSDKHKAQEVIQEYQSLKAEAAGDKKYDKGDAVMTIFAGAGGQDAEDFVGILKEMYWKYCFDKGWLFAVFHSNENDHGGFRNITFGIQGKGAYGTMKNESGVHRLVRISPFNARKQRHTSFAMVEVVPKFKKVKDEDLSEAELDIQFARSSGPGGQNVNKRETAVRLVHKETGISVHVDSERTQGRNKEKAMEILAGKLYRRREKNLQESRDNISVSKTTEAEWGSQIRSYVLHPYKMVKDHRTNVEIGDIDGVLDGKIQEFIDAERLL